MDKFTAIHALDRYMDIKALFDDNEGETIQELYNTFRGRFGGHIFNFDGESFDVELDYVQATIYSVDGGRPTLMESFDIFVDNGDGGYIAPDYKVEELKQIITRR